MCPWPGIPESTADLWFLLSDTHDRVSLRIQCDSLWVALNHCENATKTLEAILLTLRENVVNSRRFATFQLESTWNLLRITVKTRPRLTVTSQRDCVMASHLPNTSPCLRLYGSYLVPAPIWFLAPIWFQNWAFLVPLSAYLVPAPIWFPRLFGSFIVERAPSFEVAFLPFCSDSRPVLYLYPQPTALNFARDSCNLTNPNWFLAIFVARSLSWRFSLPFRGQHGPQYLLLERIRPSCLASKLTSLISTHCVLTARLRIGLPFHLP